MTTQAVFHDERGPAIHFAGRKAELGRLRERLTALCATGSPRDGLLLITGVPGAGKTELASVFARSAMAAPAGEYGRRVRTLTVGTPALDDDAEMFMAIAAALGGGKAARKAVGATRRTTGVSLTVAGTDGGFSQEAGLRPPASLGGMLQRTTQGRNGRMWKGKALVLVIDELQTVSPKGMAALRTLHEGWHGCPIILVGVGLQTTPSVLRRGGEEAGISRTSPPLVLSPLSAGEAEEAIDQGLRKLGCRASDAAVRALSEASDGFPQHIHGYIGSARKAYERHGHLEDAALREALAAGDEARVRYYQGRLGDDLLKPMLAVVAEMARRGRREIDQDAAQRCVDHAGMDGKTAVADAVRHGVLTRGADGLVSFGIPSFHDYLHRELALKPR